MADQRTMAELLRAPTEGYAEAIVVPSILSEQFELKHSLINMMTSDLFFELENDNPHDHVRWFNKITSTIKSKDVPNSEIKLMIFSFSLAREARQWLEIEPPLSILTWEDLVSKFINEFFPPLRTTNIHNEISNFQQRFDESFHEAWDKYKDLLRACPQHGFTELDQLDTFYNALNPTDQDSLNSAAGGNLLEIRTQDVLTIIKNKSKAWDRYKDLLRACPHHGFTELHQLDTFYNALNPADQDSLNSVAGGNLLERRTQDVLTIIENKSKVRNSQNKLVVSQVKSSDANSNSSSEIAKLTHAVNQQTSSVTTAMTAILKQFQATPPPAFVKAEDERVEETLTDQDLAEYTIKVPPPLLYINITLADALILFPKYQKMLKALLSNKEKLLELANTPLNENCSAVILKKLPEKLGDLRKFLIPCGFNELKCKSLADLGARINLMPLSVWKKLANFVIVDYKSDPRVPFILGRPFLWIARALIDVHRDEMIIRDGDERLILNMRHNTSSYSN
uniref:Reverse transcriptase domain-containing protein n=1 Tax=Tanacetum cinerariifolium TaxID=118510 RepID=A0A699JB13_TANCI|nr:reverse transcriptase domain-containing protein [Tanacetum cinerariifolium]